MTDKLSMRELVTFAIGGGWGTEEPEHPKDKAVRVIRGADFPAVQTGDISGAPVRWETESKVSNRELVAGDIVLEISGGTKERPTGRTILVTQRMVNSSPEILIPASFCRKLRIDPEIAVSEYVYYWLQNMYEQGRTWAYQNQSTGIANFKFEMFLDEETVTLPPLTLQQSIAHVLSSLDDKIAANNKVIQTASELLLSHYRAIEKQQSNRTLGEVAKVFGGSTPSTKVDEYWNGYIQWATPTDITALNGLWIRETSRTITEAGLDSISTTLHPENSILMTSRATIGAMALAAVPIVTNQGFIVVEADKELTPWMYCQMIERKQEFESWANGATFMELSRGNFKNLPFYDCSKEDLSEFNAIAWPLLDLAKSSQLENQTLARTRDELLPLLMNGKVGVGAASEVVESVSRGNVEGEGHVNV